MGTGFSTLLGLSEPSDDYLQLTDLGCFLSKYVFIMLDKEKKKRISKHEYLILVNQFREQKTSEKELDDFLAAHAVPGQSTEYIDESLFKKLIVHLAIDFHRNVSERMKYLVTLFDKDGDGYVCQSDLCQVYDSLGIQVPIEPIQALVSRYDKDGDNKLSEEEFENLGKSAMSKLFVAKSQSPVDKLVEDAIRKGSADLASHEEELPKGYDLLNNNPTERVTFLDNIPLGKPVEIPDSPGPSVCFMSELDINRDCGDRVASMQVVLSELELD